ncbi:MAG: hypothetical protein AUI10_00355 [Actinobacteria bacterium 13_2_20CM_2_72_6]|nr:MAG: hypothetical protein AUI10_00355 [Actinobacteria bacterium 13_2_20CM_2_72_6]
MAAQEAATAGVDELSVRTETALPVKLAGGAPGLDFAALAPILVGLPGFTSVYAAEYMVLGTRPAPGVARLVYRQDACAHLVIVAGRCLTGVSEVLLGEATAARLHVAPGDVLPLTYAVAPGDPAQPAYVPGADPAPVTVAGTYRVRDRAELYWGLHGYFATDTAGRPDEPIFTSRLAMTAMPHGHEVVGVDALAGPDAFAPAGLHRLRTQLDELVNRDAALGDAIKLDTALPALLDRIDRNRRVARQLVPIAAAPLVALAWFVIFLAVGYGTEGRRRELALVALRGARLPTRWWLAAGECVLPIVLGAAVGYAAGPPLVRLVAPGAGTGGTLGYGLAAAGGALIAALAAQRRELFTPVVDLLRRVPSRFGGWRSLAGEAVVVVLAIVAVAQLRVSGGRLDGLGMLAPALVMVCVAMLAARGLRPLAGRYGVRALRRGRVGLALAALQLGRRPGIQRLFVLLVAAVALVGFGVSAGDVSARGRAERAQVLTGASRVLAVDLVTRTKLLDAVRAVDPQGRYAMAVTAVPPGGPAEVPKLAVDTTRLATVAAWRADFGPLAAARVAELLRPAAPGPVVVRGSGVELDVSAGTVDGDSGVRLSLTLAPLAGSPPLVLDLGALRPGAHTYRTDSPACVTGCRLVGVRIFAGTVGGYTAKVTFRALRAIGADGPDEGWIRPVDGPYPLPVVSTAELVDGTRLAGLDGRPSAVTQVGRVAGLPRLGRRGTLVDLEYADRIATDSDTAQDPEVWLGPAAPPDVVDRLTAQGLVVLGDRSADAAGAGLAREGPAQALRFHLLAGGFAIVLAAGGIGLVAAVDRRRRVEDLSALRAQGVDRRSVGRAALGSSLAVVLAALVAGLVAAAVAWWATGWGIPMSVDGDGGWSVPHWPRPVPVLVPVLGAGLVLLIVAWFAGARLRRAIRAGEE